MGHLNHFHRTLNPKLGSLLLLLLFATSSSTLPVTSPKIPTVGLVVLSASKVHAHVEDSIRSPGSNTFCAFEKLGIHITANYAKTPDPLIVTLTRQGSSPPLEDVVLLPPHFHDYPRSRYW